MNEEDEQTPDSEEERQYATINETADFLRVSTGKLREWLREGLIDATRPGGPFGHLRISIKSIRDFLNRHSTKSEYEEGNSHE